MAKKDSTEQGQLDITYVKRGQIEALSAMRTEPSPRAKDALARRRPSAPRRPLR